MHLDELTRPDLIFPDLPGSDAPTVLRAFADRVQASGLIEDADELYHRLFEREQLASTGIGAGVAIPHCKVDDIPDVVMAIGITRKEVDFEAADDQPVRLFFLIVSPCDHPAAHLQALAAVSKWLRVEHHAERIVALDDSQAIYQMLQTEDA